MDTFIAFDQALACSGVAVYSDSKIVASQIRTNTKEDIGARLLYLESYIITTFSIYPKKVFYEYVYPGSYTPFESIKVLGLLEKIISQNKLPSRCFRSSSKEKRSGNSWRGLLSLSSDKKDLQAKLGLVGKANHNICDAIGILGAGLLEEGIISIPNDLYHIPVEVSYVREPQSFCKLIKGI